MNTQPTYQLDLFADKQSKMDRDFERWINEHPEAYEHFSMFAFQAINAGRQRFGAKAICERIRWYVAMEWKGEPYKINNNYVSRLARKFIDDCPQYSYLFETRVLKS